MIRIADPPRLDLIVVANVRRLLAERGQTQRSLAAAIGTTEARLSHALSGPQITLRRVAQFSAALGVQPAELVSPGRPEKISRPTR